MKKRWKAAWISVFAAVVIAAQLFIFPHAQAAGTPTALTINQSGIYFLSGTCSDGSVTVKKGTTDVTLILDNLTLSSADSAPICLNKSTAVTLTAKEGSVNTLSDTEKNNDETYASNLNAENAVIKCKDRSNVVIDGSGTIIIAANGKSGIKSGASTEKEGNATLTIKEVTLEINAPVNDAINAEASLAIESGSLSLSAGDDAIHSDYDLQIGTKNGENVPVINISSCYEGIEGANIHIDSGDITVHATDDGINAANGDLKGYAFTLDIAGGTVLAVGNSGMAQTPGDGSQNYLIFTAGQTTGFGGGRKLFGNRGNMQPSGDMGQNENQMPDGNAPQGATPPEMPNNSQDGQQSDTLNISAGDSLEISDASGNVIYSSKAVRNANYVLYSSPSLSDSETYSLSVNGTNVLSTTISDSKNVRGFSMGRPNGGQNFSGNENANADSQESAFADVKNKDWFFNAVCLTSAKKD